MISTLRHKRILVTREKNQAIPFAHKIEQYGGQPIITDLLKIDCTPKKENAVILNNIFCDYDWFFFTSANGVHCFFKQYKDLNKDLKGSKIAVVGSKTKKALMEHGYEADFIPSTYNAETMAKEFMSMYPPDQSIMLVRGKRSRPVLVDAFTEEGRMFTSLEVYETTTNYNIKEKLNYVITNESIDFITFTSPSTVEAFVTLVSESFDRRKDVIVCIGTTTEKRALELGFSTILVPDVFTIEGMLEKMSEYERKRNE